MEKNLCFYLVPVRDIKSAKAFYRDVIGLEESWREGDFTVAYKLPGSEIELMIDQVVEGGPDAAGPVFIVPSVEEFYKQNHGKINFTGEPSASPDGLWLNAKDDSGNGLYFIDQSGGASS